MKRIAILGTGSYVPKRVLSNSDLEKFLDTNDEWISSRTGVRERRIAAPDEYASDMGRDAARRALEKAGMSPLDVELIVMCTMTPDTACPSGANWLEASLGAENAVSFDVVAACSGFVFGLNVAEQYLKAGTFKNALVVASEVMSRTLDWTDRESCILWGDGSGAAVLGVVNDGQDCSEILSTHIHTDGKNGKNLLLPGGGSKTTPISHASVDQKLHYLRMIHASESVRTAVKYFAEAAEQAVSHNGHTFDDIKIIIPHQANIRILQQMAKRLKVPMEKIYLTVEKYGNISSATIPIALDEAVQDGTIRKGDFVVLAAFGGGLTWGSSLIRW